MSTRLPVAAADRLSLLEALVDELPALLRSSSLTRVVPLRLAGDMYRPALSIGLLLEVQQNLVSAPELLDDAEQRRLAGLRETLDAAREGEPDGFRRHLEMELSSHIRAWSRYVEDCEDGEPAAREDRDVVLPRRLRVALLLREAEAAGLSVESLAGRLPEMDARYLRCTQASEAPSMALDPAAFPPAQQAWLYRQL